MSWKIQIHTMLIESVLCFRRKNSLELEVEIYRYTIFASTNSSNLQVWLKSGPELKLMYLEPLFNYSIMTLLMKRNFAFVINNRGVTGDGNS